MVVASLRIDLVIPGSASLKDKRHAVRSLRDRIKSRFNVSVAEVDHQDLWQRAALGIAVVSADGQVVREVLDNVRRLVEQDVRVSVLDAHIEIV